MDEVSTKREALKGAYSGAGWASKVQKMDDAQVIAVYLRLKAQGKVN